MNSSLEERLEQLQERIKIDETNLSAELISHPHDFWHAARGTVDAISQRDKAKAILDSYSSNLNMIFRQEAAARKERVTEAQLDYMVMSDEDRIKLQEEFFKHKKHAELWQGMKESFIQKGYALKSLVDLSRAEQSVTSSYAEQRRDAFQNYRKPD